MTAALVLGLLTGADNFWFGLAVGLLPLSVRGRWLLAGAFAVAEFAMTVFGAAIGLGGVGGETGAGIAVALAALLVCTACALRADLVRFVNRPSGLVLVPLALSLDNLTAGASLSGSGFASVAGSALVGAAFAAAGLYLSAPIAAFRTRPVAWASGLALAALAAVRLSDALL